MHKQIGNAVPVLLAEKVAKGIRKMIESKSLRRAA
jgi:site-specific DNA-cytosine methylase